MRRLSILLTTATAAFGYTLPVFVPDADGAPPSVRVPAAQGHAAGRHARPGCRSSRARAVSAAARARKPDRGCPAATRSTKAAGRTSTKAAGRTRTKLAAKTKSALSGAGKLDAKTKTKTTAGARRGVRPSTASTAPTPAAPSSPASDAVTPAQDRAAAIAAALATTCQNTELIPTTADLEQVRAAVLCLINQKRAQNGEAPLALNSQLVAAAEGHSQELVSADYFAHVSPSGLTPVDRIRETGYIPGPEVGYVIGENLAWGTYQLATPQSIVAAWIASPGHLANILESQYVETGIGVTPAVPASLGDGAPGATYAQEFGVIIR